MAILQFEDVSFAYPGAEKRALSHINLSIEEGTYMVLCGPSGCGKTTLLRQAKKELAPAGAAEGTVFFRGKPLEELSPLDSASGIGFVQQNPDNQIVTDFVWHELAFGLENLGLPTQVIRRRVAEMAAFFGISPWYRKHTWELSGGQKQLLNLASIMAMDPELLILDEPTSMLDPLASRSFLDTVRRIHDELGVAILLTEHRMEEVFPAAGQVVVMDKGEVLSEGSPAETARTLLENPDKNRLYFGLPSAVRIFASLQGDEDGYDEMSVPLTVGEGRRQMRELLGDHKAQDIPAKALPKAKTALKAQELWFRYEETGADILRGLSLEIKKGQLLCLLGGNGAGKTTLLKLLSGLSKPYRGRVKLEKGERLGLLPQSTKAMFTMDTVREELLDSAEGDGQRMEQAAEQMELKGLYGQHPYDLSGGETQRLALAKLLLKDDTVLLLDEPTKGMDAYAKDHLAVHLKALAARGAAILLVTHDLEFAARYADRCAMMFDGMIHSEDEPHRFFAGNRFYTTDANRIGGEYFPNAITCEEVAAACREQKYLCSPTGVQRRLRGFC